MLQPYKDGAQRMTDGIHAQSRMLGDVKFHSYKGIEASVGEKWKEHAGRDNLAEETQAVAALLGYESRASTLEPAPRSSFQLSFSDSEQPLVAIQARGWLPPFFCVHAVGGNVFSYVGLSRRLGRAQPFYALQARGLMGGQEPHTRVEEMAADYIHAIRAVQESGPYVLGGWSMGGLVAFEMACQLQRQGQQVALVALFDSIAPYAARFIRENEQARQVANFAFHLGLPLTELANVSEQLLSLDEEAQLKHLFKLAQRTGIFPKGFDLTQLHHLFKVYRSNNEAALAYRPRACSTPLVLFRAAETMEKELTDTTYGWSHLAEGSLEIEAVTGNHFTMLDEPHVSLLAEKLRVRFARATSSTD
jgi:thioesterase domain-containing protein